jgi:hypothetical protein
LPAVKWFPLYWPNETWEVRDLSFPMQRPQPPDGAIIPWWKMPKDQWPIEAPWEHKVLGAWPASQITMSEDLPPSIWPRGHKTAPFGFIKLKMPREPDTSDHQIAFLNMKMHMAPELGPIHHMKIMTQRNALGETKFYMIDKNWNQYDYDYREYRKALREKRIEKYMEKLAAEIASYNGVPKPSKDLFP